MSAAWEVFAASLDPVELERERLPVGADLFSERPGCRRQRDVMASHDRRVVRFWADFVPGVYVAPVEVVKAAEKPARVSQIKAEPTFTEAQLRIARLVAENATSTKWVTSSKKREATQ
jgi:hypothetical protein